MRFLIFPQLYHPWLEKNIFCLSNRHKSEKDEDFIKRYSKDIIALDYLITADANGEISVWDIL